MSRKAIPKSVRFEVFKRDSFTCQYCGRKPPDVILHVDHIVPVSKGGTNDILNLVTSCVDCNLGKSDRELSDNSVIEKQHSQLSDLQERKNQIEMMFEWQKSLLDLDEYTIDQLSEHWKLLIDNLAHVTPTGRETLRRLLKKYRFELIMEAMRESVGNYYKSDIDTARIAFDKLSGICYHKTLKNKNPDLSRLYYVRGIMRNRLNYCDDTKAIIMLKDAHKQGVPVDALEDLAKECSEWDEFRDELEYTIGYYDGGMDG